METLIERLFPRLYSLLQDIHLKQRTIITNQELIMTKNDEANAAVNKKLDELQTTLDEVQASNDEGSAKLRAEIETLTAQANTGEAGLTADQVTAALARISAIEADLRGDNPPTT